MSKQKEEEKQRERVIADEGQMTDISDEEAEPADADEVISQTMPVLYQAIVDHNIEVVRSCLDHYEAEIRELYTDEECYNSDVHNIYRARMDDVEDMEIDDAHTGMTPIQLADRLGYHDICHIFISYGDDRRECIGETEAEDVSLD